MKVKKYTASTMPEAMKVVRSELGQSAVILNSREQKTKGFLGLFRKKYIEVFAAIDPNPRNNKIDRSSVKSEVEASGMSKDIKPNGNQHLLKEIEQLKAQLSAKPNNQSFLPEPIQTIMSNLREQDIEQTILNQLNPYLLEKYYGEQLKTVDQLKAATKQFFLQKLDHSDTSKAKMCESKYVYLFGPTGVGKTTTIAKLAASQSISEGKKVAFITLDTYRIAAIDQLKTYAKILNVPIEVAYSKEDLIKAKEKFSHYDVIFIDSAGRNYRKEEYIEQIQDYVDFKANDEVYCVLSLTSKQKDLEDIYSRFSKLNINRVIFTKIDETTQFGPIYNLWNKYQFQMSYLTNGQNVPDDIQDASPELIVDMLVGDIE